MRLIDVLTLTKEGDWNQHGDVGIQRGVGGWFNDVFGKPTNGVSNTVSGYTVSGSTVTLTLGTTAGDETQSDDSTTR